ncbi:MAG: HEAT repeat domain-containing protein [Deltaproteobacteria bacterium]|nr:HEAT repeat domain-containing protein [Deltaproteobacteria bacterium]
MRHLEMPLERARGRLEPTKILSFARSPSARVRAATARILGYFRASQVQQILQTLIHDLEAEVRIQAVEALVRVIGVQNAAAALAGARDDVLVHFIELIEFAQEDA